MATTLSQLWKMAMEDLRACEQDPNFIVDMKIWYEKGTTCVGCMAGAVIHQQGLKASGHGVLGGEDGVWHDRLLAINNLRTGFIRNAFRNLYGTSPEGEGYDYYPMPVYSSPAWWSAAEALLKHLETLNA